jgi:hypothetical protein
VPEEVFSAYTCQRPKKDNEARERKRKVCVRVGTGRDTEIKRGEGWRKTVKGKGEVRKMGRVNRDRAYVHIYSDTTMQI